MNLSEFMRKYNLQNKATSNKKISEVINKLGIKNFNIYMRDDKLTTKQGIINIHPTRGTHWVCYYNKNYFDSFGVKPPKSIDKQLGTYIYSTFRIQKRNESQCASYCLYVLYLINIEKLPFDEAVIKLWFSK